MRHRAWVLCLWLCTSAQALSADEEPSLEMLEFLASDASHEDMWLDPEIVTQQTEPSTAAPRAEAEASDE